MGGAHHCVVADTEQSLDEPSEDQAQYIRINGDDLRYLTAVATSALAGAFGPLTEVRVVARDGKLMIGTNGHASQYFGHADAQ